MHSQPQRLRERFGGLGSLLRDLRLWRRWRLDIRADVKLVAQGALVLLALNAILGMTWGQNRLALRADVANAHAHSGVLGWVTLGAIGFALQIFGPRQPSIVDLWLSRALSLFAVVSMFGYAIASLFGSGVLTVAGSGAALLTAVALVGWLGMRSVQMRLEAARIAFLLAALALVFCATVGLLLEAGNLTSSTLFPDDTAIVQPIILDAGYLLLLGIALVEWGLARNAELPKRDADRGWLAALEVSLPFLAVCALALSIMMGIPALVPVATVLELATAGAFLARHWPTMRHIPRNLHSSQRSFAIAAVCVLLYLALFIYTLARISIGSYASFGVVPLATTAAIGHLLYVGVLTNALFAMLALLARDGKRFWSGTDDILFWGMNGGLLGFAGGLLAHNDVLVALLEGLFSPILGATILLGVVVYLARLSSAPVRLVPPSLD